MGMREMDKNKKESIMNMSTETITTKIAAVLISFFVAFGMLTAAPVRAAEDQNAGDQMGGAVQTVHTEQTAQTKQTAQTEQTAQTTQAEQSEQSAQSEQTTQAAQTEQSEQAAQTAQTEQTAPTEQTEQTETKATQTAQKTVVEKMAEGESSDDVEIEAPDEVDNIKAVSKGRGRIVITWSKVKDADGYYIYRAKSKKGEYKKIKKIKSGEITKYSHKYKKLRKNKRYYFKVYAYKRVNGETVMSESADRDAAKNTLSYKKKYTMKATAYSGGGLCANGKRCKVGRVAVDPDVIPLGTWLYVKGYGFCQACDTGGAIQGMRIDLYYNSESKCNDYGVRKTKVYVLRK